MKSSDSIHEIDLYTFQFLDDRFYDGISSCLKIRFSARLGIRNSINHAYFFPEFH